VRLRSRQERGSCPIIDYYYENELHTVVYCIPPNPNIIDTIFSKLTQGLKFNH